MSKPYVEVEDFLEEANVILGHIVDIPQDTSGMAGIKYQVWGEKIADGLYVAYLKGWRDARNIYDKD